MRELPPTAGLPMHMGIVSVRRKSRSRRAAGLARIPEPIMACSGTAAVVALRTLVAAIRAGAASSSRPTPARSSRLAVRLAGLRAVACDTLPGGFESIPARSGAAAMKPRSPWSPRIWAAGLDISAVSPWPMPMEPS
ncbi:MAG: hypothetical protein ACLSTO_00030 [Bilophila wadsworthia]